MGRKIKPQHLTSAEEFEKVIRDVSKGEHPIMAITKWLRKIK